MAKLTGLQKLSRIWGENGCYNTRINTEAQKAHAEHFKKAGLGNSPYAPPNIANTNA